MSNETKYRGHDNNKLTARIFRVIAVSLFATVLSYKLTELPTEVVYCRVFTKELYSTSVSKEAFIPLLVILTTLF